MDQAQSRELAQKLIRLSLYSFCLLVPLSVAGANISWGLLLAGLLAYKAAGKVLPWGSRRGVLEAPLWFYFGVSVLTAALGVDFHHSLCYLYQDAHKVWLYLLFSVALAVEPASQAENFLALGLGAAALVGIGQSLYVLHIYKIWLRAHAFVHPVTFGEQMCFAVLGASCFLLAPQGRISGSWRKVAAMVLLFLTTIALFMSGTEGAIVACAGAAAVTGLSIPKLRRLTFIVLPALFGLLLFGLLTVQKLRFHHSLAAEIASWRQSGALPGQGPLMRATLWDVAWRMGKDHPWTGVGLNNYRSQFRKYFTGALDGGALDWGTAHNLYLHHFAERGVLGLAALALLLATLWGRAFERARRAPDAWNLWAFSAATAFLIMNLTEVALQTEVIWMLIFFLWIYAEARFKAARS